MSIRNARQITKFQNSKNLIEFNDRLAVASAEAASSLHSPYSKIHVVALDYSQGTGDKTVIVEANIDPEKMKYLAHAILHGQLTRWSEQKILAHRTNENGESRVTIVTIEYNEKMNSPWIIQIENGMAIPVKTATGGTMAQKGSYRREKAVRVFISDEHMKTMMLQVLDYIRAWEIAVLPSLVRARNKMEEEERASRAAEKSA